MRKTQTTRGLLAALSVAPLLALAACGSDPVGVELDGERYLDQTFEVDRQTDVQYGSATNETGTQEALLLDLYLPADDTLARRPAVVWLHGGSFQHGHKGEMADFALAFARRGFASVSIDYRLLEGQVFDYTDPDDPMGEEAKRDAQHDAQAAVRWLRANADDMGIDPDLIFLAGYSAGGTAALRAAAASPDDTGSSGNPGPSSSVTGVVAISSSVEEGVLPAATGRTLLIHGSDDAKVPITAVEAACGAVSLCTLVSIQGAVHNMIGPSKDAIIAETVTFLHGEVAP